MRLIIALVIIVILAVIISKYLEVHSSGTGLFIETPFSSVYRIFHHFFYNKVWLFQKGD